MGGRKGNHTRRGIIVTVGYSDDMTAAVDVPDHDTLRIDKLCRRWLIGDTHHYRRIGIAPVGLLSADGQCELDKGFAAYGGFYIGGQSALIALTDADLSLASADSRNTCQHI
ncbi:hypothetical protein SDC9_192622 [bioreactor metagenome]|uniref:Uncharacterized protein n=1 Tax=bioreactor metagenome TaxID=1076179 RepID=A0A645I1A4_9ZZZZ